MSSKRTEVYLGRALADYQWAVLPGADYLKLECENMIMMMKMIMMMVMMSIGVGVSSAGTPPDRSDDGGVERRNRSFELLNAFMQKYERRSASFRERFPKYDILWWSDYVVKLLDEISISPDGAFWMEKATELLVMDGDQEE